MKQTLLYEIDRSIYPPILKYGWLGNALLRQAFKMENNQTTWGIFHCHVWLPENPPILQKFQKWRRSTCYDVFIGWVRKQQWPMPNQNQRICLDQNTSCNIIDFDHIPAILTILFNFCIRKSLLFSKNLHLLKVHPKMVGLSNTWLSKKWWATTLLTLTFSNHSNHQ